MKKWGSKLIAIASCFGLTSCSTSYTTHKISMEEAKQMMDTSIVIDVREIDEFNEGHIQGAINIPLGSLENQIDRLDKEKPILIYCRSGNRSAKALKILNQLGFDNVYDFGGIINWPYEIVRE